MVGPVSTPYTAVTGKFRCGTFVERIILTNIAIYAKIEGVIIKIYHFEQKAGVSGLPRGAISALYIYILGKTDVLDVI